MNSKRIVNMITVSAVALSAALSIFPNAYTAGNIYTAVAADNEEDFTAEFISLVNDERAALGLDPLIPDPYINEIAQIRAEEQTISKGHTRPDGTSWTTVIDENCLHWKDISENVLAGGSTPEQALAAWKSSPPHWEALTSPDYKYTGVGFVYDSSSEYGYYWAQIFSDVPSSSASSSSPSTPSAPSESSPSHYETSSTDSEFSAVMDEFLKLVNEARSELGAEALIFDPYLNDLAQMRAEEQLAQTGHTRPDGTSWITIIDKNILHYGSVAENVLRGTSAKTAKVAFDAWKSSSGHWKNLTNPEYKYTGLGIVYDPNSEYGYYWANLFSSVPSEGYEPAPKPVIYGDINGDKRVDVFDYVALVAYIRNSDEDVSIWSETQLKAADCFNDGIITEADAKIMMRYILGDISALPSVD